MIVFLDTNIAGAVTNPSPKSVQVQAIQAWATAMDKAGHQLVIPAVVDYELRREHELRKATVSIAALDAFLAALPGRYLPLSDSALKLAAQLWASVRQRGLPTADTKLLDCDILIAAQVLDLGLPDTAFVVVTDNVAHLSRVIACDFWQNINP